MKPEQFIRWYGIEEAKYLIEQNINCNDFEFSLEELKRLVESVDLVLEHYTVERAEVYANSAYTAPEIKVCLLDAIADYKSIYGGGDE